MNEPTEAFTLLPHRYFLKNTPIRADAQTHASRVALEKKPGLTADDYYYTPEGLMVFTEAYHRKRGYCCQNGCRHCPYGFKKKQR